MAQSRSWGVAAAVSAAAFLFALLPLPSAPAALSAPPGLSLPQAVGAIHVHTHRSDGSGSIDEIAAAAARAGLQFVVVTDHGDGTRAPDAPRYSSGVLLIDAVELSTSDGHYIAIGMPKAPYPLRGEGRDVAEDVRRLGGFGIVAHPHSAKPALQWRDWSADIDAIEWLNADTEWRDETPLHLSRALLRYPFRPVGTLVTLLDRPDRTLSQWDQLTAQRPIVAVAGADAHARLGWNDDDHLGYRRQWYLRIPSYDVSFAAFANRIALDAPLTGDAGPDATAIVAGLRRGRVFSTIDGIAAPGALEFTARAGGETVQQGSTVVAGPGVVRLTARANVGATDRLTLFRDGNVIADGTGPVLTHEIAAESSGTYRVEATHVDRRSIPLMLSNPIYVQGPAWGRRTERRPHRPAVESRSIQGGPWHSERDRTSLARFTHADPPEGQVEFVYRLGDGAPHGQYAALVIGVGTGLAGNTRLAFGARASQPMRIAVQARTPQTGARWQRSIYLDTEPRNVVLAFDEMRGIDTAAAFLPEGADTVLFVVDLTNTSPGAEATFTIENLRVER